ncbi:MAG: hypothetical protein IJZ68_06940 [Bacteroidaceae bacterium]|nr:hypothetical protein [Bacteroidaceae bacterium]
MTGQKLCDILHISYDDIVEVRRQDAQSNLEYFADELCRITPVVRRMQHTTRTHIDEPSFMMNNSIARRFCNTQKRRVYVVPW